MASAYEAEVEGYVKLALSWVRDAAPRVDRGASDGLHGLSRNRGGVAAAHPSSDEVEVAELREMLDDMHVAISLQWISGHVGLKEMSGRIGRLEKPRGEES